MTSFLATRAPHAFRPFFGQDPYSSFQQDMDHLLSRFKTDWGNDWSTDLSPMVDVSETDDALQVRMDVPGLKAEEINIEVSGNTLRVSGEHKEEKDEKGKTFHRMERRCGTFARTLTLPSTVKESEVSAESADGVLTITLPKTEAAKTQKVTVKPANKAGNGEQVATAKT